MNLLDYYKTVSKDVRHLTIKRPTGNVTYKVDSKPFRNSVTEHYKVMIKRVEIQECRYAANMRDFDIVPTQPRVGVIHVTIDKGLQDFLSIKKKPVKREISFYYSWKKHEAHLVRDTWICDKKQPTERVSVKKSKKDKVDLEYAFMYAYLMLKQNLTSSQLKRNINNYLVPYGQQDKYNVKKIMHEMCIKECPKGFDKFMNKRIKSVKAKRKDPKVT